MKYTIRPHKWYRIEMTATGQVYLREVQSVKGIRSSDDRGKLTAENVGRYTCSCAWRYL